MRVQAVEHRRPVPRNYGKLSSKKMSGLFLSTVDLCGLSRRIRTRPFLPRSECLHGLRACPSAHAERWRQRGAERRPLWTSEQDAPFIVRQMHAPLASLLPAGHAVKRGRDGRCDATCTAARPAFRMGVHVKSHVDPVLSRIGASIPHSRDGAVCRAFITENFHKLS